jgi:hypothetical protein
MNGLKKMELQFTSNKESSLRSNKTIFEATVEDIFGLLLIVSAGS